MGSHYRQEDDPDWTPDGKGTDGKGHSEGNGDLVKSPIYENHTIDKQDQSKSVYMMEVISECLVS